MNPISQDIAKQFCELCNWTFESWITHKLLFDDNKREKLTIGKAKYFSERLSVITQEYCLLQICKLHDPPTLNKSSNVTIDYILQFGDWGTNLTYVNGLVLRLADLFEKIKPARNKLLAHNDLNTLIDSTALGAFPEQLDKEYFLALQELVNAVSKKWFDVPYPFNDLAGADVEEFLNLLEKARQ